MVSAFDSGWRGPGSSPGWGHLCCVLGQDTLLLLYLSPSRSIGTGKLSGEGGGEGWGGVVVIWDGPASHPRAVVITTKNFLCVFQVARHPSRVCWQLDHIFCSFILCC